MHQVLLGIVKIVLLYNAGENWARTGNLFTIPYAFSFSRTYFFLPDLVQNDRLIKLYQKSR